MLKVEMEAEKDKTTKNFDRYKFESGDISGSAYFPKGASKVKITVDYE
jgi:hypothetical protein